jgi:hypothetical protein
MLAVALQSLAYAQKQRGERDEAEASAREGLALALAVDDQPAMAWGLVVLASTEADLVPARAAELLAAAEAAYTRLGLAWDPLDLRVREEVAATVRARLDDALLGAAHAAGSQTELDAAVKAALG